MSKDLYWEFENGNKYSRDKYTFKEAEALYRTLKHCWDCIDCSYCNGCYDCENCDSCYMCRDCKDSLMLELCENCTNCTDCDHCDDCDNCSKSEYLYSCKNVKYGKNAGFIGK